MSSVLKHVAVAIGGILFFIALGIGLATGVTMAVALFRAFVIMMVGTTVISLFFRFFTTVLFTFIAERLVAQRKVQDAAKEAAKVAAGQAPV